jgi:hypothetical protein
MAISGLIVFVAWELGLRLHDGVALLQFPNFIGDQINQAKRSGGAMYDQRLGWRLRPDLRQPSLLTGAYGNRLSSDANAELQVGGILVSGDSFTLGSDVDDAESWPAYLETISGTPVINAAAAGWGTDQIIMRAEEMIDIARPQTVIVGFLWYDIGRSEAQINFGAQKPYYTIEDGRLELHNVPVPPFEGGPSDLGFVRGVLGYSYAIYWAAERLGFQQWLGDINSRQKRATPNGTGQRITCLLLRRLKQRTDADGIRLLMVMEYGVGDFGRPPPSAALDVLTCARDMGIETVDMWKVLAELYVSDLAKFRSLFLVQESGWSHMSADGNRFVAAAIADWLRATKTKRAASP